MVDFNALVPWRNNELATKRDEFFDPLVSFRRAGNAWHGIAPAVDIQKTDKEMVITTDLPGVSQGPTGGKA